MAQLALIFGIFLLYKLVVDFIIPIYRVSKQVKAQFKNMQQGADPVEDPLTHNNPRQNAPSKKSSDYIDFEEIKD